MSKSNGITPEIESKISQLKASGNISVAEFEQLCDMIYSGEVVRNKSYDYKSAVILSCRQLQGISQEELAKRLDVSLDTVGSWEIGRRVPKLEKVIACIKMCTLADEVLQRILPKIL